jgi:hypothetical protein
MNGFWMGLGWGALIGAIVFDAIWRSLYKETVRFYTELSDHDHEQTGGL